MSVRETLELDISDALASIEQVGDRLANVAQAFGEVLSESLEAALNGLPVITPEVDATPVSEEVEQALTEGAATPLAVDVDATSVTDSVEEALESADTVVPVVVDAEAVTSEVEGALADVDATISVTVDADTSQAEAAVDGLGDALEGAGGAGEDAAGGFGGAALAAGALGRTAGSASGLLGKATGALAAVGPAGVAVAAAAASVGFFYDAAFESVAVTQAWQNSLGPLGARIEDLDSGTTGLSGSLRQLAQDTGSSDEAVLIATQRYAEFQRAAGFTNEQIVANSQGIAVLAAQIRANNPNLGTMDEIITALGRSLQRGGPRLQNYGIALNLADIEARALADTGKTLASELTNAEKSAAGLAIATEQLNPNAANLADGLDNVAIKADRARQKFGDALEAIGKPLVEPITDAVLALAEAFEDVAAIVAELSDAFSNKLTSSISGVTKTADGLVSLLERLGVVTEDSGEAAEEAAEGFDFLGLAVDAWIRTVVGAVPALGPFLIATSEIDRVTGETGDTAATTGGEFTTMGDLVALAGQKATAAMDEMNAVAAQQDTLFQRLYDSAFQFVQVALSSIPQVTDVFRNLGDTTNADVLTGNLQEQIAATNQWAADMEMAYRLGLDNISGLLAELGPTQSAILLEQYAGRETELETHLELMAIAQQRAAAKANEIALRGYLRMNDITGTQADAIVATLGARLQLEKPTREEIEAVINAPATKELEAMAAFGDFAGAASKSVTDIINEETGKATAKNLDAGLGEGLTKEQAQAVLRAAIYAQAIKDKINEILGVKSPSTEMMKTGRDLVLGLSMGIDGNAGLVDSAMEGLGRSVLGVNLSAGAPTIRDVTVQVPVTVSGGMTVEDGRAIGAAAGQAAATEVARMMRLEARVA